MSAFALLLSMALASSAAPPLGVAGLAPADVDAVIQVRGGLREEQGSGRDMLRQATAALLRSVGAADAWRRAAGTAGMKPEELLDRCAGRDASLVVRQGEAGMEWVLALEIAPKDSCELLKALGGRVTGSRRFEIPRLGVVGARHGEWLLVTDDSDSALLRDMHRVGCEADVPSLASELPQDAVPAERAAVVVALRHRGARHGRSVWSITPSRQGLRVEVDGRFASDPFGAVMDGPEPAIMLEAMPEETVACWMQPMPTQPLPATLVERVPDGLSAAIGRSLGDRMAVIVGPGKAGAMAIAVAYEVRDARSASEAHDALLMEVARQAGVMTASSLPPRSARRLESPRDLSETGLAPLLFGGMELFAPQQLHARTVCMSAGGWRVYANEREWLDRVVASLEEHPAAEQAVQGPPQWVRSGFMQGGPLGAALHAWSDQRATQGRCAEGLQLLAEWAKMTDLVSWRMAQPEPGRVRAVLDLTPALEPVHATPSSFAVLP